MTNLQIREGDTFSEWTVVDPNRWLQSTGRRRRAALVRCSCSTPETQVERVIHWDHLRSGNTKSCGHYRASGDWRPVLPKRMSIGAKVRANVDPDALADRHVIRLTWNSIKDRCLNPNVAHYPNYGGRGIALWEPWREDSNAFIDWVIENLGPRPANPPGWTSSHPYWSIDRIDNNGDYAPGNVRWADPYEQRANQREHPLAGVVRTPKASTWGYRIQRRGEKYAQYGFRTPEEAKAARDAKLSELKQAGDQISRRKRTVLFQAA